MITMLMSALALFPAQEAGDCCEWKAFSDGKRTTLKRVCPEPQEAPKLRIEVKPEDARPGDDWGFKTVGKTAVKTWYRYVDPPPAPKPTTDCSKSKDDCNYGYFLQGKQSQRRSFCEHDGARVFCGPKPGECQTCLK
jgi:hypothetical protein